MRALPIFKQFVGELYSIVFLQSLSVALFLPFNFCDTEGFWRSGLDWLGLGWACHLDTNDILLVSFIAIFNVIRFFSLIRGLLVGSLLLE